MNSKLALLGAVLFVVFFAGGREISGQLLTDLAHRHQLEALSESTDLSLAGRSSKSLAQLQNEAIGEKFAYDRYAVYLGLLAGLAGFGAIFLPWRDVPPTRTPANTPRA